MSIFVEKWPLFSRSIISGNTKHTEKLINKKIFVIFSTNLALGGQRFLFGRVCT